IFDVMGCEDAFKTRLVVYKFEGNVLAWSKAYKQAKGGDAWSTLNHLMCMSYTDVAQVANVARNYKILHQRDDDDTEKPDKRQKSGDRHQPTSQQSSHRNHGHNNDRHGSDRRGGSDNHRSSNNNYSGSNNRLNFKYIQSSSTHKHDPNTTSSHRNHGHNNDRHGSDRRGGSDNHRSSNNNYSGSNNKNSGYGRDQRNRGQQSNRSTISGSQQSMGPSEGYSYPVCTTCRRRHPGECHRAAGTCFKCVQAGHLQKDCKKNTTASTSGQADKKPG
nr:hypothetical protein [Tanacetum cinerariifolium]